MNTRLILLLLCVLLAGCDREAPTTYFAPSVPGLTTKLGITDADWIALQKVAAEETGMAIFAVGRATPQEIEIQFGDPKDSLHDQGGPFFRYEKNLGVWTKDKSFIGYWSVGQYGAPPTPKSTALPTQQGPQH